MASVYELERLADEKEKGTVSSIRKLEEAFAHVYAVLGQS